MKQAAQKILPLWNLLLLVNIIAVAYSLWSHLYGNPRRGGLLIFGTLFVGWVSLGLYKTKRVKAFMQGTRLIATNTHTSNALERLLNNSITFFIAVSAIGWLIFLITGFFIFGLVVSDYSSPIFAERDHYVLNRFGDLKEVSRWRYIFVGISLMIPAHTFATFPSLALIHKFLFGGDKSGL